MIVMVTMTMMVMVQEKWSHSRAASGSKRSDGSFSDSSNSFVRQVKLLSFHVPCGPAAAATT